MYDLKIINGTILDQETGDGQVTDIGIKDGKIIDIGALTESGAKTVNAEGFIISPGFIDIHMHEEQISVMEESGGAYDIAEKMLLMGVTTCLGGNCGLNFQFPREFLDYVEANGAPVNYLCAVGHNFLRERVGNSDWYGKSTRQQIIEMSSLANKELEAGAWGVSLGLEYCPGVDFDEAVSFLNGIERNVLTSCHFRKDGIHGIPSVIEMIDISKETKKPMQISHLGSGTGYGMMKEALDVIQQAIDDGVDVMADCYPYSAFCTNIGSAVFDEGCFQLWNKTYDSIMLTEEPYRNRFCDEELFHKVRKEFPEMYVVAFVMNDEDIGEAYRAPFIIGASDGIFTKGQGHPRGAGTFPRILGKFARDEKILPLHTAIKKITSLPAKRLGLAGKGEIKAGFDADLVIFDPETILDGATFESPTLPPVGIKYVISGGKICVKDNIIINGRQGKAIRYT